MTIGAVVLFVILGLCLGSFANGVTYRLPRGQAWWRGRSACPNCHHVLGFYELIPMLSWIWQRGRCRHCRQPIAWRYNIGELTLAVMYGWAALALGWSWQLPLALVVGFIFLVLFWIDLEHGILPDSITLPTVALVVVAQLALGVAWQSLLLGALIGGGFFGIQYALSHGQWVGGGDIRLGALLGVLLGWPVVITALILAYWSGAIVGVWLLVTKRAHARSAVPFGPFLVAAGWVVWLLSPVISQWYSVLW